MGPFSGALSDMEKKKENNKKSSYESRFEKYKQSLRDKGIVKKHRPWFRPIISDCLQSLQIAFMPPLLAFG